MAIERFYEPLYPWRYLKVLADYLVGRLGQAWLDQTLLEVGIVANIGDEQGAPIPAAQVNALLQLCMQRLDRGELVFEWAKRIRPEIHGPLGWAVRRCKTLEDGLQLAVRHYRLVETQFFRSYQRTAEGGELILRPAAPVSRELLPAMMEMRTIGAHVMLKELLRERLPAYDIYYPFERPSHAARYAELRPARVHFGAQALPEVRVVFSANDLSLPFYRTEGQIDEDALRALLGAQRSTLQGHWSGWVQTMLREAHGCQPSQEQLAGILNVSPHTLARRLADEGFRFRDMARMVRHQRACEMLTQLPIDVAEIAHRLGYTSVSNFCHAFRAEAGVSPRAYRTRAADAAD